MGWQTTGKRQEMPGLPTVVQARLSTGYKPVLHQSSAQRVKAALNRIAAGPPILHRLAGLIQVLPTERLILRVFELPGIGNRRVFRLSGTRAAHS